MTRNTVPVTIPAPHNLWHDNDRGVNRLTCHEPVVYHETHFVSSGEICNKTGMRIGAVDHRCDAAAGCSEAARFLKLRSFVFAAFSMAYLRELDLACKGKGRTSQEAARFMAHCSRTV